jgi:hypothetical protein
VAGACCPNQGRSGVPMMNEGCRGIVSILGRERQARHRCRLPASSALGKTKPVESAYASFSPMSPSQGSSRVSKFLPVDPAHLKGWEARSQLAVAPSKARQDATPASSRLADPTCRPSLTSLRATAGQGAGKRPDAGCTSGRRQLSPKVGNLMPAARLQQTPPGGAQSQPDVRHFCC